MFAEMAFGKETIAYHILVTNFTFSLCVSHSCVVLGWEFIKEKKENTHENKKIVYECVFACVFSCPSSFFAWTLSCTSACFLERVLFCVDACVFSCFLTFFFSFINSQPWIKTSGPDIGDLITGRLRIWRGSSKPDI